MNPYHDRYLRKMFLPDEPEPAPEPRRRPAGRVLRPVGQEPDPAGEERFLANLAAIAERVKAAPPRFYVDDRPRAYVRSPVDGKMVHEIIGYTGEVPRGQKAPEVTRAANRREHHGYIFVRGERVKLANYRRFGAH